MFLSIRITVIICIIAIVLLPGKLVAQSASNATASATIMDDPGATITQNINFGLPGIELNSTAIGDMGNRLHGNYKMIAAYNISNYAFTVTLPPSTLLKREKGFDAISADLIMDSYCNDTPDQNSQTIIIGAVFNTITALPPGNYTSHIPFNITVNYN